MLNFQLTTHENYIKKFVTLFKELDRDTNGVLNEEEFKEMIKAMNVTSSEDIDRLLQLTASFCLPQLETN